MTPELRRLAALQYAAALGFVSCALIVWAVVSGASQAFDRWGLLAFRDPLDLVIAIGPAWLGETARDFTSLGSNGVLATLAISGAGLLASASRRPSALFLLASFFGALALNTAAKFAVARPRPELVPALARTFTSSFPSSHATVSAAFLLAVVILLFGCQRAWFRFIAAGSALALLCLIGLSRIYLGVHWPTDVIGGWVLGFGWVSFCARAFAPNDLMPAHQRDKW